MRRCLTTLVYAAISLLLVSCGGGGGGTVAEGGIGGTGISMGRVAQVGSVYVNGTHYDTDSIPARFIINGDDNRTLTDISVGMVVTVTGSRDAATMTGVAETVAYNSLLVGPIDTFDPLDLSTLGVMGQTVLTNADTVFDNPIDARLLEELTVGDMVEVSGFSDSVTGDILATRIVLTDGSGLYRLTGISSGYSSATQTLQIGAMTVDLSALAPTAVADGSYIHVTGDTAPTSGTFYAQAINPLDNSLDAADGTEAELEGVIASGLDADDRFVLNGQTVDAAATPYSGQTSDLAIGRVVSVSGVMENGILLADEINLQAISSEREEIAAVLQPGAVDASNGRITLMGQEIRVDSSTIYESDLSGQSTFTLSDLNDGQFLEAKIYDNMVFLRASKLELEPLPGDHDAKLEGYATSVGANELVVLGVTIDTSGVSGYNPNQRLDIKGTYDAGSGILTATEIHNDD